MKRMAIAAVSMLVAGGGAGVAAVNATGHDPGPPTGTVTVDAQFPSPESGQLQANLADPHGNPATDDAKIADVFTGNGKLFQSGRQVGTLHFDNIVTQATPARTIITVILVLPHGTILTEGVTDLGSDAPTDAAVIGGTGAYGGARGTVRVNHLAGTDLNRAVVTFVR
jgi:hypothetical protein